MPITVDYEELDGSPESDRTRSGMTAVRVLKCAWADWPQLREELLAWPGHDFPHSPIMCRATRVNVKPFGVCGQDTINGEIVSSYPWAKLTVYYDSATRAGPIPEPGDETNRISEQIKPTVEAQVVSHEGFRWGSPQGTPLTEEEAPFRQVHGLTYEFTRYNLSAVPNHVLTLNGKVNNAGVLCKLLGLAFGPETLLYQDPDIELITNEAGTLAINLTQRMQWRESTWNKFWRAETGEYEEIHLETGGRYMPFPPADFSVI